MKNRIRNYVREYQERLKRAAAQGLSKSQARGHPRAGEQSVSAKAKAALEDARIQQGLRAMRKGETLSGAARSAGLSSERLRRHLVEHKIGRRRGRRWYLLESRLRWQWQIMSSGARCDHHRGQGRSGIPTRKVFECREDLPSCEQREFCWLHTETNRFAMCPDRNMCWRPVRVPFIGSPFRTTCGRKISTDLPEWRMPWIIANGA